MKHETILVPVKCSERLPDEDGVYYTNQGQLDYFTKSKKWYSIGGWNDKDILMNPGIWYEEENDKIVLSEEELQELANKIWDRGASGQPFMNEELFKPDK